MEIKFTRQKYNNSKVDMNFSYNKRISRTQDNISQICSSQSISQVGNQMSIQKINHNREWLNELYLSKKRFQKFIQQISHIQDNPLRQDVLAHFQNSFVSDKIYQLNHNAKTIQKLLNGRIQKMIKNKRIKKNWSEQDIQILTWIISKFADKNSYPDITKDLNHQDWKIISTLIPGVTAQSCMFKWLSLKKVNLVNYNWSVQQSQLLSQIVKKIQQQTNKNKDGKDWKNISQKLYKFNQCQSKIFRNAKQCRQHWNCYLNPKLKKGPWSSQQDINLLKKIFQNKGPKKWSQIVKNFNGRTQNALKNRYALIIQKQKQKHKGKNELQLIDQYLEKCYVEQFTSILKIEHQDQNMSTHNQDSTKQFKEIQPENCKKQKYISQNKLNQIFSPMMKKNPLKIQKIKIQNFANLSRTFNFIQPGVINSDGSFSQLTKSMNIKNYQS